MCIMVKRAGEKNGSGARGIPTVIIIMITVTFFITVL